MDKSHLYGLTTGLLEGDGRKKILLIPESQSSNKQDDLACLRITKFPHPGTGAPVLWAFKTDSGEIFQLVQVEEKHSSWFIGNFVLEDGSFYTLVPIDPLFLVVPALLKAKKKKSFQTVDQILSQWGGDRADCQAAEILLSETQSPAGEIEPTFLVDLDLVCRQKNVRGTKYWKLCQRKLANWTKAKVDILSSELESENVNVTTKVFVSGFARSRKDVAPARDTFDRFAFGMLCDFLPLEIRSTLGKTLSLRDTVGTNSALTTDNTKKRKGDPAEEPLEDYSKSFKPASKPVVEKKLTAAQKQLQKVDKTGMKSLASYFKTTPKSK